ncbi:hypothetical protein ACE1AT_01160 [Pelatocladus sp. BLCC-F211]|uniref:hypothetical protein n=1 Tax=Pelatocladus sp. BLCC-F211 TaxID=3342752 RepID=UPI0035B79CC0
MKKFLLLIVTLSIICNIAFQLPVFAQTNKTDSKETSSTGGIPGLIGGAISGLITGLITSWLSYSYRIKELEKQFQFKEEEERRKEIAQLKRDYLNPLKLSAEEVLERLDWIIQGFLNLDPNQSYNQQDQNVIQILKNFEEYRPYRQDEEEKNNKLAIAPKEFHKLIEFEWAIKYAKDHVTEDYIEEWKNYVNKCNGGIHYFAFSSLYLMVCYISYANKMRDGMPFTVQAYEYNSYINTLIQKINKLREVLGVEYGIWTEVQDSIGEVAIQTGGKVINYKEFYTNLREDKNKAVFLRLCNYYWEIDQKIENILDIRHKLNELVNHLNSEENHLNKELFTSTKKSSNVN